MFLTKPHCGVNASSHLWVLIHHLIRTSRPDLVLKPLVIFYKWQMSTSDLPMRSMLWQVLNMFGDAKKSPKQLLIDDKIVMIMKHSKHKENGKMEKWKNEKMKKWKKKTIKQ